MATTYPRMVSVQHASLMLSEPIFPSKLYQILDRADELGLSDAVSWLPHGRAFLAGDSNEFKSVVLGRFFKATKYRSFTRQLNLWGFRRVPKGPDAGAWYHDFFLRGKPEELKKLIRVKVKGNCSLRIKSDKRVPNFNEMPHLPGFDYFQYPRVEECNESTIDECSLPAYHVTSFDPVEKTDELEPLPLISSSADDISPEEFSVFVNKMIAHI